MYNNLFIFRIYLLLSIIILCPICYFITLDLIQKTTTYSLLTFSVKNIKLDELSNNNVLILFKSYIKQKKWLTCILMLEFYRMYSDYRVNNLMGICYQKLCFYQVARHYYILALNDDPNNLSILQNLLSVCKVLKDNIMINQLFDQIDAVNQKKIE